MKNVRGESTKVGRLLILVVLMGAFLGLGWLQAGTADAETLTTSGNTAIATSPKNDTATYVVMQRFQVDTIELGRAFALEDKHWAEWTLPDGTPCYMPGYGTIGRNPVADGSQFMVDVAWHTFQQTRDTNLVHVALDTGYPDSTHFSHSIRQVYGLKPSDIFAGSRRLSIYAQAPQPA